jgi:hypothetical protein
MERCEGDACCTARTKSSSRSGSRGACFRLTGIFENNASARRPTKLLNQIHHDIVDDMVLDNVVDIVVDIVVSDVIVVVFMCVTVVPFVI